MTAVQRAVLRNALRVLAFDLVEAAGDHTTTLEETWVHTTGVTITIHWRTT